MAIPSGAVKAVHHGILPGGEEFTYSLWGDTGGGWSSTDLGDWTAAYVGLLEADASVSNWINILSNSVSFDAVNSYLYAGGSSSSAQASVPYGKVGGAANVPFPNQVATVCTLLTGRPGRSYRGRAYLPAPSSASASTGGQLSAAVTSTICNAVAGHLRSFVGAIEGKAATPVVVSSRLSAMTPITSLRVDSRMDVQRRRAFSEAVNSAASVNGPWT